MKNKLQCKRVFAFSVWLPLLLDIRTLKMSRDLRLKQISENNKDA